MSKKKKLVKSCCQLSLGTRSIFLLVSIRTKKKMYYVKEWKTVNHGPGPLFCSHCNVTIDRPSGG